MSQQQYIDEISVASSNSRATNSSKLKPLPGFVRKELAELIESNGGIQTIGKNTIPLQSLLCLSNNESFGGVGDPIRIQIGNLVQQWKLNFKKGTYESKVLKLLQVQPFASHREPSNSKSVNKDFDETKKQLQITESPSNSSKSSSESDTDKVLDSFNKISLSEKFSSPPAKQISVDTKHVPETPMTPVIFNDTETMSALPLNTTTLEVDLDFPGNTYPFIVYPVDELFGVDSNVIYKGFSLVVQIDPRWVLDDDSRDFFSARIFSNDSVLVGIPAMPYDVMYSPKQFMRCGAGVVKAMDIARNKIWKDEDRLIKHYLLTFPVPRDSKNGCVQLSTKEIYDNKDDACDLELIYEEVVSHHKKHKAHTTNQFAVWNVARIDVDSHKVGRQDNTGPKISKAEAARRRREEESKSSASLSTSLTYDDE